MENLQKLRKNRLKSTKLNRSKKKQNYERNITFAKLNLKKGGKPQKRVKEI